MSELFRKHLDLKPLKGRSRGLTFCLVHKEKTPSFSVDLTRGLFHCFGCGVQGGELAFAKLVGAPSPSLKIAGRPALSPMAQAREDLLRREQRAAERRGLYRGQWQAADDYREMMKDVRAAQRVATAGGPTDDDATWELLTLAAHAATQAEADLAEVVE